MIIRPDGPISGPMYDALNGVFGAIAHGLSVIGIPFEKSAVPLRGRGRADRAREVPTLRLHGTPRDRLGPPQRQQ